MSTFLRATDYEILRNVPVDCKKGTPLERRPVRVATILHEDRLKNSGFILQHGRNVFLEDRIHDWQWDNGVFRFYTRIAEGGVDVLIVYEEERVTPSVEEVLALSGASMNFDPQTGEKIAK